MVRLFLIRVLVCVFAFQLFSHALLAGTGRWTTSGPEGGTVDSLAGDPTNPDIVFAGMDGAGVFKSQDAGVTWRSTTLNTGRIIAIQIDPSQPANVFAASTTSLFKSTDAGESWKMVGSDLPASIQCLALDRSNPSVLYAGAFEGNPTTTVTRTGLYQSTDAGETWRLTGLQSAAVTAVTVDPKNGSVLYTAVESLIRSANNGLGIWKSIDRGATWKSSPELGGGPPFGQIVIDPVQTDNVYAVWFLNVLFKSSDAGATWRRIVIDPERHDLLRAGPGSGRSGDALRWDRFRRLQECRWRRHLVSLSGVIGACLVDDTLSLATAKALRRDLRFQPIRTRA